MWVKNMFVVARRGEAGHPVAEAAVENDREVGVSSGGPERLALGCVDGHAVIALRPDGDAAETRGRHALDLADRQSDVLQWRDAEREQPSRIGGAEVGDPSVVGTSVGGGDGRIFDVARQEVDRREEHRPLEALFVEHREAGDRVVAAWEQVVPRHDGVRIAERSRNARWRRTQAVRASLHPQLLAPAGGTPYLDDEVTKGGVGVLLPDDGRLDQMTVGVDHGHGFGHVASPIVRLAPTLSTGPRRTGRVSYHELVPGCESAPRPFSCLRRKRRCYRGRYQRTARSVRTWRLPGRMSTGAGVWAESLPFRVSI